MTKQNAAGRTAHKTAPATASPVNDPEFLNAPGLHSRFLTRRQLAERWACSGETIKRKTKAGLLTPLRFNTRLVRYPLSQILAIEHEAGGHQ